MSAFMCESVFFFLVWVFVDVCVCLLIAIISNNEPLHLRGGADKS